MRIFFIIIFIWLSASMYAQISYGGQPFPFNRKTAVVQTITMPVAKMHEALERSLFLDERQQGRKPMRFAWNFDVSLDPATEGNWMNTGTGTRVWRISIKSPGANGMSIFFDQYELKAGARLFIYDLEQTTILGGFTDSNNKESNVLPTAFIPGESLVVELQVPRQLSGDFGNLRIGRVSHAFVNIFGSGKKKDDYFGTSGACNVDINCPEGDSWQLHKRAVCRIIFQKNNYTELCTGTLMNNSKQDETPYFLTANHCIKTAAEAESAVLYFMYESPECGGEDGNASLTISSTEVLATSDSLDFSLLMLSETPPESYIPYYAGFSIEDVPPEKSTVIHHPWADVKKISIDNDPARREYQSLNPPEWLFTESVAGAFWRVENWETGTTEGGSSGAPLFNQKKQVAGNLTGGDANCSHPWNDYFSKFHMCWDYYSAPSMQLKYWLDAPGTVLSELPGYDPYNIPVTDLFDFFHVYPNPSDGLFNVFLDTLSFKDARMRLYDLGGKMIGKYHVNDGKSTRLELSHLKNGMYILEIEIGELISRKKIVIEQ